ncbi:LOW QUALITY PROTEIN: E3 ubiquitin-protein ligase TRIM39 [Salmo salar]|uniref:LOW QUALITY PROTEIN: E3 ubiquitin-protein ligase TRIM39 n=1 Tax=Salmo salar TaxID=8030 RepID=A0A1S3RF12_SALSA|nr:LOW QUALITY PROTEIN: E3 ubiquitin-protein ligase TRIM39 [Salmo salar]
MASSSILLSEEQFLCSICLDVFTEPVTTSCGHNFCIDCITKYWNSKDLCHCPLCKEKFSKRPKLRVNTMLREVVGNFKSLRDRGKDESPAKLGKVPCDVCTGTKRKALKSCLVCLASYCETHLDPHHIAPAFKRHKLVDPVENLEDRMCKKHDRLLELFCRTDQTCVCQTCVCQADHKTHDTVPIEEECGERKAQLGKTEAEVQQIIQERLKKVKEIKLSVDLSKRDAERERADSIQVFTALVHSIEKSQAELIEVIEEKQKAVERQAEGLIKELDQEITELKRRSTDLKQLSQTEDHLQLLQSFPSIVCTPQPTKDWSEISVHSDLCVGTVRKAVSQLEETLNKEMEKLPEVKLKRIQQYAVDVTLDPDTANLYLILSEDGKQVRLQNTPQKLPDNPKRFNQYLIVLGKDGFSSGRFYYEVTVKGKTDWDLGVARESTDRKGIISPSSEDGVWTVVLRDWNQYTACASPKFLSLIEKPQKVGVFVDYEVGQVSFYDVEAKSHIYSFTGCTFTEKLYPYFSPCDNDDGKNSAPLIISPVNHTH